MKSFLACVFVILPTTVMAQTSSEAGLSAEALTRALNTSLPQQGLRPAQTPPVVPARAPVEGVARPASPPSLPPALPQAAPVASTPPADVEALTRALNQGPSSQGAQRPSAQAVTPPSSVPNTPQMPEAGSGSRPATPVQAQGAPSRPSQASAVAEPDTKPARAPAPSTADRSAPSPRPQDPQIAARPSGAGREVPASPTLPKPAQTSGSVTPRSEPTSTRRDVPVPGVLSAVAIQALPFQLDMPPGIQLVAVSTARDARVWALRKGPVTLAMVFAGRQSQFPIFEGEQVTVAGRTSVVLTEGVRRVAVEHLFQRADAPQELHIWLMASEGADRDLAEQIAQTLDYR